MGLRKTRETLTEPRTEAARAKGPGLRSISPATTLARKTHAAAIADAMSAISAALDRLPSETARMRAYAAVAVAHGLDMDALHFLDRAHGWEYGRCARCGRTWRGTRWNE